MCVAVESVILVKWSSSFYINTSGLHLSYEIQKEENAVIEAYKEHVDNMKYCD
jgi:hypothetical protein